MFIGNATKLNNLAAVLVQLGRLTEAQPLFDQALEIFLASLPAAHPNIAVVEEHISDLQRRIAEEGRSL